MSTPGNQRPATRARVLCFVSGGPIALAALAATAARHDIACVVRPAASASDGGWRQLARRVATAVGMRSPDAIDAWAAARGIPSRVLAREPDAEALRALSAAEAEVACIATYPHRLPAAVRAAAAPVCLNVHPSLLPRHRGAGALLWTYHAGDAEGGVSVHHAIDTLDAGAVVAQQAIPIGRGESIVAVHARCAALGGALLADAIGDAAAGGAIGEPQDEARATTAPGLRERRVRSTLDTWSAAHAWHFLAGVAPMYRDPFVDDAGQPVPYLRVPGFETRATREAPGTVRRVGAGWEAWTRDGVVFLAPDAGGAA